MVFRPCRTFPGEVEDFFCTVCRVPCSALSLLVGIHTNHTRVHLSEALESAPTEFSREFAEYLSCVQTHCTASRSKLALAEHELAVVHHEIEEVNAAMQQLETRREKLFEQQSHLRVLRDEIHTQTRETTAALATTGINTSQCIRELLLLYSETNSFPGVEALRADQSQALQQLAVQFERAGNDLRGDISGSGSLASFSSQRIPPAASRSIVDEHVLLSKAAHAHCTKGPIFGSDAGGNTSSESSSSSSSSSSLRVKSAELEEQFQCLRACLQTAAASRNSAVLRQLLRCVKSLRHQAKQLGLRAIDQMICSDPGVTQAYILAQAQ
jgi:hypothetical protein